MQREYSRRSPAVKRLMREAQELHEPTENYYAQPLDDNLFEWHFTVRGPPDSEFEDGLYHGRITFPPEYPMKPPSIILLTPNGRFEIGKKICLSISGYHPETWQPSWSIRTVLLAIIGFMPTHGHGAIGSLDYTPDERKILAKRSKEWKCKDCREVLKNVLKERRVDSETSKEENKEAQALAAQINFKEETKKSTATSDDTATTSTSTNTPQPVASANQQLPPYPAAAYQQHFQQMSYPNPFVSQYAAFAGAGQPPQHRDAASNNDNTVQPPADATPQADVNTPLAPEPATANTENTSQRNANDNATTETNIRQRNVSQQGYEQPRRRNDTQSNQNNRQIHQQENSNSFVLIVLLSLALAALMLRRLFITYEFKFDYNM